MPVYRFNDHELLTDARRLSHRGHDVPVGVRVFDIIAYLVEHRERAIGRDELIAAVWGRADGADALLAQAMVKARRVFGDDGQAQHYIRTVPRFGYQWVAATCKVDDAPAAPEAAMPDDPPVAEVVPAAAPPSTGEDDVAPAVGRSRLRRRTAAVPLVVVALVVVLAVLVRHDWRGGVAPAPASPASRIAPADATVVKPVPGLILVAPTAVHSSVADDGWMRLGVMSLGAQALAHVPGHDVVPDDTVLAAVAGQNDPPDPAQLRAATGATLVVLSQASQEGSDWVLNATLSAADGSRQMVSARASDPVVAAGALARKLRDLLAPADHDGELADLPPDVLALGTRMKAAILDGQNSRALALFDRAATTTRAAPSVVLLRAEALVQLGRAGEAADSLRQLLDGAAVDPTPRWLAAAWSRLGDCELSLGHPDAADAHFRRSIALLGQGSDHRTAGLAWRGLGIAQAVRNDLAGAEASYLHARLELEPIGDRLLLARVTDGLAYVTAQSGHLAKALLMYQQAVDFGSAFGHNETELGSRLNLAQTHQYLLQHSRALEAFQALLPRVAGLDYPALHRFGLVGYAEVLGDTGAWTEARRQLDQLDAEAVHEPHPDAVTDMRLDVALVRLQIGDVAVALRKAKALRASLPANAPADRRLELAALLLRAEAGEDPGAAAGVAGDADLWKPANALAPARAHALVALATWHASQDQPALAATEFAQALELARAFGAPVILRDVIVPYAPFQIAHQGLAAARATASLLGPYTDDDFESALLLARLAVSSHQPDLARSYFSHARSLAGERWTDALSAEQAAADQLVRLSPES
jgi:DNA-binding winged helix-turn-helix (wHTH) protein/tetratricopeptide (TPR) repeat protein